MISPLVFIICVIILSGLGLIHTLLAMRGQDDEQ